MNDKKQKNVFVRFFQSKRETFESLQEISFERNEKRVLHLLNSSEEHFDFPIPTFVPFLLLWLFILFFPLVLILDPGYLPAHEINTRNMLGFYLPLILTLFIFQVNQKILVSKFIFKKRYAIYFICNFILVGIALGIREVAFFLVERDSSESWGYFFTTYCFSAVKGHFSIWSVVSYVILVTFVCVICVFYQMVFRQILKAFILREQKRVELQYELDFLKNQLSPHFLFNTLNNISALIQINPQLAEKSMGKLSKLLRVMLYQTSDKYITLQDDVDILEKYTDLEKLRLDDNFDFKFDVHLDHPERKIEPLLVMPLVENSMKHCVNPRGKSFVHVSIVERGDELLFHSENSNFPRKSQAKASGLGLTTFQKRLDLLYDEKYEYSKHIVDDVYVCDLKIKLHTKLPNG